MYGISIYWLNPPPHPTPKSRGGLKGKERKVFKMASEAFLVSCRKHMENDTARPPPLPCFLQIILESFPKEK